MTLSGLSHVRGTRPRNLARLGAPDPAPRDQTLGSEPEAGHKLKGMERGDFSSGLSLADVLRLEKMTIKGSLV